MQDDAVVPVQEAQAEQTESIYAKAKPWREDISWWVIAAQGILMTAIGLYIIIDGDDAKRNVLFAIALFLLINSLLQAAAGLKDRIAQDPQTPYRLLRGGMGTTVAVILLADRFSEFLTFNAARALLGAGFVAAALIGIFGQVQARATLGLNPLVFVPGLLFLALGGVTLYAAIAGKTLTNLLGWTALVIGILLLALAGIRKKASTEAAGAPVEIASV